LPFGEACRTDARAEN